MWLIEWVRTMLKKETTKDKQARTATCADCRQGFPIIEVEICGTCFVTLCPECAERHACRIGVKRG